MANEIHANTLVELQEKELAQVAGGYGGGRHGYRRHHGYGYGRGYGHGHGYGYGHYGYGHYGYGRHGYGYHH